MGLFLKVINTFKIFNELQAALRVEKDKFAAGMTAKRGSAERQEESVGFCLGWTGGQGEPGANPAQMPKRRREMKKAEAFPLPRALHGQTEMHRAAPTCAPLPQQHCSACKDVVSMEAHHHLPIMQAQLSPPAFAICNLLKQTRKGR